MLRAGRKAAEAVARRLHTLASSNGTGHHSPCSSTLPLLHLSNSDPLPSHSNDGTWPLLPSLSASTYGGYGNVMMAGSSWPAGSTTAHQPPVTQQLHLQMLLQDLQDGGAPGVALRSSHDGSDDATADAPLFAGGLSSSCSASLGEDTAAAASGWWCRKDVRPAKEPAGREEAGRRFEYQWVVVDGRKYLARREVSSSRWVLWKPMEQVKQPADQR